MKGRPKNLTASIHARLRNEAAKMNVPFNAVLQYYGIERLLYRLSISDHARTFVLKGGVSFLAWRIPLRRFTKDIDLLGHGINDVEHIVQVFREICRQTVTEDGVTYDPGRITGERTQLGAQYQGIRLRIIGSLGRAVIPIQIDIGFGDPVLPSETETDYPTILEGLPAPVLDVYTHEAVIAEKAHAMVILGNLNSRMKDFYDIWLLAHAKDFEGMVLQQALRSTFAARKTPLPLEPPIALTGEFVSSHQQQWRAFVGSFEAGADEEKDLGDVIHLIRSFVLPPLNAAAHGTPFRATWQAGNQWSE
jgi:predicted nucleotidyltransferase component of viral defense system